MRRPALLYYLRDLSPAEFDRISHGLVPASMDEKWYIFKDQNEIFFCRSWTMKCVYRLEIESGELVHHVRQAWVDRSDYAHPPLSLEYAGRLLGYLMERMLLGREAEFPFPDEIRDPLDRLLFKYSMVGGGLANDEYDNPGVRMGSN